MWLYNDVHSVFVKQIGKNIFHLASFFEAWGRVSEEDLVQWSRVVDLDSYSAVQIQDALLASLGLGSQEEIERALGVLCESDLNQRVAIAVYKFYVQKLVHEAQQRTLIQPT